MQTLTFPKLAPAPSETSLWANGSKVVAIGGTTLGSYLGLRLIVWIPSKRRLDLRCLRNRFLYDISNISAAYLAIEKNRSNALFLKIN